MALGYTLATGEPGVFNVVPGPGLLNATAGMATAYALNAKVFCLTGQILSRNIGKGIGRLARDSASRRGLARADQVERHCSTSERCRA